ncbi:ubiquinol-cytochrome-c reductase complex assembly factor 3 isoform X2 [Stegostoma tigrinum]|uniref:ubiquinol-cytochrome-c reductase complex assembly factor 3 isoform X2 n=1 Tax=Stegostoma tigrinum TaxID=3053191 RepID=UPI00202B2F0C|nr:ubiquinol-cytochrome-c reductase complex assembly factor 3 isoform X2 [Stegostoma tigrinum]
MRNRGLAMCFWTVLWAAGAGLCWVIVGPSEQRSTKILQHLPESNQSQLEATQRRNALVMQIIKESADCEKNVAREMDWNKPSRKKTV